MHSHHEDLIKGISEQFMEIMKRSEQALYIYLDDSHKICNENFARLLGYKSAEEWSSADMPFTEILADESSREALVEAYQAAMKKMIGSSIEVTWKKKSGGIVKTNVILVPVSYSGHLFALHFVSKKQ